MCSNDEFYTIIDLPQGDHQYRFLVDGQWMTDPHGVSCSITVLCNVIRFFHEASYLQISLLLRVVQEQTGVGDNGLPCSVVSVRESDFEVFEALAVDSVSTGEEKYKGALS